MDIILVAFAVVFGICFGSFLNVLIFRIPLNKSVVAPSSACMSCGNKLRFYHNIPIISYLFLRGKCGFCGAKISPMYPIIEAISGLIAFFVYLKFGFTLSAAFFGISILLLLALSVIDIKTQEVPDSLNFSALIFALIGGLFYTQDFLEVFGSACALAGCFTLLRFALQSLLKKEALGEGDIIVVATMGAMLGWKMALFGVFLSAVFSLIILLIMFKKDQKIPYIPFLALGLVACLVFEAQFVEFLDFVIYP